MAETRASLLRRRLETLRLEHLELVDPVERGRDLGRQWIPAGTVRAWFGRFTVALEQYDRSADLAIRIAADTRQARAQLADAWRAAYPGRRGWLERPIDCGGWRIVQAVALGLILGLALGVSLVFWFGIH